MRGVLHIGAEKTGTTTLQAYFSANRALLRRHRIAYPRFPGTKQHSRLALYAMDPSRQNRWTRANPAHQGTGRHAWEEGIRAAALTELVPASRDASELLVSTELCHSQLRSVVEIQRLKSLLDLWCNDYTVILYLRRQDELATSLYSTYLRTGGTDTAILPRLPGGGGRPRFYDFETILDEWSQVFGHQRVVPRVFERSRMSGGDLVRDFFDAAGLSARGDDGVRPPAQNTALSATSQELLRHLNLRLRDPAGKPARDTEAIRRAAVRALEAADNGKPLRPSRRDAEDFHRIFAEGNARIAREWFGRDQLFSEDFSGYPDRADPRPAVNGADLEDLLRTGA